MQRERERERGREQEYWCGGLSAGHPDQPNEPNEPEGPSTRPENQVKQKSNSDDEQHSSKKNMKTSILSFLLC
jgi:hypothetical protein